MDNIYWIELLNALDTKMNLPSPIQQIYNPIWDEQNINLYIKREDLIHPTVNGNKYRKLKYNLALRPSCIITFGGAFSNHIHATASAGKLYNISTVGIIRGERDENNPTLLHAQSCGMKLHFVDRASYRLKEKSSVVKVIIAKYTNPLILPEGGNNEMARKGTAEVAIEINQQLSDIDVIALSAGTGGTAAGILTEKKVKSSLLVFSALKGNFLKDEIFTMTGLSDFELQTDYHFGGYARTQPELISFINTFYANHKIVLDPIYNGKGLYGLIDKIKNNDFPKGSKIVWILTGGQQGNVAWNYMNGGGLVETV